MTQGAGNEEMVRVVAEQLFKTWKSEQEREAKDSRRWWQSNAAGWGGLAVLIISLVLAANNISTIANSAEARSIQNTDAIIAMRVSNSDRLARIETKVDRILEDRQK